MCKKNIHFSVQVWFKQYHLKKYEKKCFNQHRTKTSPLPSSVVLQHRSIYSLLLMTLVCTLVYLLKKNNKTKQIQLFPIVYFSKVVSPS